MRAPYSQTLLDRAQAYVEQPLNRRRYDEGLSEISQLYADITGEAVGKCRQCQYSDYLAVVTAYIREATRFLHPETVQDSKYTFAPGFENEVIADARYTKVVKAENLTDQDAEHLIKLGYGHVLVLKPGQESLVAGDSEQIQGDALDEDADNEPTEREKEQLAKYEQVLGQLQAEQAAHEVTKSQLAAEKQAHTTTKGQLTKVKTELARKTTVPPTASAQVEPVLTASTAPDGPAEVAPAVPAAPADGTASN